MGMTGIVPNEKMCHIVHMKALSIRDLHLQTGHWVRKAQRNRAPIIITDRGRPVATLTAFDASTRAKPLPKREAEIRRMPLIQADSASIISEMRDRS
jgi:prevent-host-death family protein